MPTAKKASKNFDVPPIRKKSFSVYNPTLEQKMESNFSRLDARIDHLERINDDRRREEAIEEEIELAVRRERRYVNKACWIGFLFGLGYGIYATIMILKKPSKLVPIPAGPRKS